MKSGVGTAWPQKVILRTTHRQPGLSGLTLKGDCGREDVVERVRALGLSDAEIDEILLAIGCIRVVHRSNELIAYYTIRLAKRGL